jgi:hypothetical protein
MVEVGSNHHSNPAFVQGRRGREPGEYRVPSAAEGGFLRRLQPAHWASGWTANWWDLIHSGACVCPDRAILTNTNSLKVPRLSGPKGHWVGSAFLQEGGGGGWIQKANPTARVTSIMIRNRGAYGRSIHAQSMSAVQVTVLCDW